MWIFLSPGLLDAPRVKILSRALLLLLSVLSPLVVCFRIFLTQIYETKRERLLISKEGKEVPTLRLTTSLDFCYYFFVDVSHFCSSLNFVL